MNTGNLRSSQDAFENIQQIELIKSENSFKGCALKESYSACSSRAARCS